MGLCAARHTGPGQLARLVWHGLCYVECVQIIRTPHFRREQLADDITEAEIASAWTRPDLERQSQDHPGAVVRTARQSNGSGVTVVGRQTADALVFITTWRH